MADNRVTAALADRVAAKMKNPDWKTAGWEHVRDHCDIATDSDLPNGELNRLTDMVCRRVGISPEPPDPCGSFDQAARAG